MTRRPLVAVLARDGDAIPGLEGAEAFAEVRLATDDEAVEQAIPDVAAVLAWDPRRRWLERLGADARKLRWLQSSSDGIDHVLVPSLVARDDVMVTNARGIFDAPIAEWVIGAMLAMATGLHRSIVDQAERRWTVGRRTERLEGRHLVVVGPGPIGRQTATRAIALGMTVVAVGRTPRHDPLLGSVLGPEGFHEALGTADFVLDALPSTRETIGMFDARAFAAMRPGARFLNVGRGSTVDQEALVEALRRDHLGGAALDVFAIEPLPADHPLWRMPDVIVSPHISGDVEGYEAQTVELFLDNLGRFVRGDPLRNLVDAAAGFGIGDGSG